MVRAVVFEGTGSFAPLAEPRQPTLGLADLRTDVPGGVFEGTGSSAPLAEPKQPTLGLADLRTDVPGVGRGTGQARASRGNGVAVRELPVCSDPHVLEGTGIFVTLLFGASEASWLNIKRSFAGRTSKLGLFCYGWNPKSLLTIWTIDPMT